MQKVRDKKNPNTTYTHLSILRQKVNHTAVVVAATLFFMLLSIGIVTLFVSTTHGYLCMLPFISVCYSIH